MVKQWWFWERCIHSVLLGEFIDGITNPTPIAVGSLLLGAGIFNVVEGLIDHEILGIHHVKSGPNELAWDIGFLAIGAIVAIAGWILVQKGRGAGGA